MSYAPEIIARIRPRQARICRIPVHAKRAKQERGTLQLAHL